MKNTDNNFCRFYNNSEETISHVFVQCSHPHSLWKDLKRWVHDTTDTTFEINERTILLGLHSNLGLGVLFLIAKLYIYKSFMKNNNLHIKGLQNLIQNMFEEQKYLSSISHTSEKFTKKWSLISLLIRTI